MVLTEALIPDYSSKSLVPTKISIPSKSAGGVTVAASKNKQKEESKKMQSIYSRDTTDYLLDRKLYAPRAETAEQMQDRIIREKERRIKLIKRQDKLGLIYKTGYSGIVHVTQIASISYSDKGLMQWHYNFKLQHSN